MPAKKPTPSDRTPSLKELYKAYKGVCQITLRKIKLSEASIEHVLPASKGGRGWANCVLVSKHAPNLIAAHNTAIKKAMSGKSHILLEAFGVSEASMEKALNARIVKVTKKKGNKNSRLVRGADGRTLRPLSNAELNTGWKTTAVDHGKADSMAGWPSYLN